MTRSDQASAPARLLGLRLQGFKSFADRTIVEFGAGISAVVGPNGSGKSNLADALRWALGEQGRSLRTRKSEDVIFAGSERRAALGMADVTLVLDNADGLLPVEYQVVELGRRLYRSGENDYLLNKQRVRLRDLVDLLDAAHLADNAFLFIGQGMVDQALALRPEERRPLFEEVAGVRRHERRRRRAEEQLAEAEANLARVEDIVGELRPQARRLAAQAEQQTTRTTAGEELAAALVVAAHARWHEGATRARQAAARFASARREVDGALTGLQAAERDAVSIASALAGRAELEREARAAHDEARASLTALRLRAERVASDLEAIARDRRRVDEERRAAEAAIDAGRRELSQPAIPHNVELESALEEAERVLADAVVELATARSARAAQGEALAAARRAEAARQAELDATRRRVAEAERRVEEERLEAAAAAQARDAAAAALVGAEGRLAGAIEAEHQAAIRREAARVRLESLEGIRRAADERASGLSSRLATMTGRLQAHRNRLAEEESRGIARGARRHGGRRLDEELDVEPGFRGAVEAVLGDALRAYVVDAAAVSALSGERGTLALDGHGTPSPASSGREKAAGGEGGDSPAVRRLVERAEELGGGLLVAAIRRDGTGIARRLLATSVWSPDLASAMAVQGLLPTGWVAVTRDGTALVRPITVSLGASESVLDRRAEVAALEADVEGVRTELAAADAERAAAADALRAARDELEQERNAEAAAGAARRRAEDEQRTAARDAERAAREAAWHAAQYERLAADRDRNRAQAAPPDDASAQPGDRHAQDAPGDDSAALLLLDARVTELRARRDRLAAELAAHEARRLDADRQRSRAEASVALDEQRLGRADRDAAALADREMALDAERAGLGEGTALAQARDEQTRRAVDELQAADAADRSRMAEADATATRARERLRTAEDRLRSAEVADLEARLALESVREQVLVELAGLGEPGIRAMRDAALPEGAGAGPLEVSSISPTPSTLPTPPTLPTPATSSTSAGEGVDEESAALEGLLVTVARSWEDAPPRTEPPSAGRLGALRRRYHELGAPNPFAVEEYAAVRVRLESLEGQRDDLRSAIARTRTLIEDLDRMIAEQFRMTFQALEVAFDARFRQLFGGGFARLSLTEPADLAATGVEIVARPPGKKAQALAMLSGGERALTAVALLFAMLEVRPVPFCVLDEVDAALDEANVDRFAETLRGLAAHTQFVVITHNRGTIEAADALYGVTVGDDSVSRVISLRLEEATAIAEAVVPAESIAG